jgi:hypothetical protein
MTDEGRSKRKFVQIILNIESSSTGHVLLWQSDKYRCILGLSTEQNNYEFSLYLLPDLLTDELSLPSQSLYFTRVVFSPMTHFELLPSSLANHIHIQWME